MAFSPPQYKPVNIGRRIFSCPESPQYQYKSVITGANVNEQISARKTKPGTSLWCEIGHLKGINDGSFQHNCLIMPGRWGTALTRTHCATSLDSPQQKANQCDSLFSNEWEGEWKKENGERRRGGGGGLGLSPSHSSTRYVTTETNVWCKHCADHSSWEANHCSVMRLVYMLLLSFPPRLTQYLSPLIKENRPLDNWSHQLPRRTPSAWGFTPLFIRAVCLLCLLGRKTEGKRLRGGEGRDETKVNM